ncbi:MAG: hypothetical protein PHN82_00515 [bacterium]|nr:hypothetical protein [bacterium]
MSRKNVMERTGMAILCGLCAMAVACSLLPAEALCDGEGHVHGGADTVPLAFRLHGSIKPVGVATYASLWITFLLGILKFKLQVRRIDMRWHYGFAVLTVALATVHLSLVEIVHRL